MADLKRLIAHFTYHIEAKPDGSFVAHATDPNLPPLEAPTRWELQQKIQQNISAALAAEFPGLQLPTDHQQLKASFHIERTPDGSFTIHSTDPNTGPTEAAPHEIESKFAEKLIGFMGKHVLTGLSPELAAQLTSGDIKVFVNRRGIGNVGDLFPTGAQDVSMLNQGSPTGGTSIEIAGRQAGNIANATDSFSYSGDNSPIHRSTPNSRWGLLRFLIALIVLGAIAYFYLRYR
jgi:hypothetical protein